MTTVERIVEKAKALPEEQQRRLLAIASALATTGPAALLGRFAHCGVHLPAAVIDQGREEMAIEFPREARRKGSGSE